MKIRRITTAGAPLGAELPPRPERALGEETRERRRTQARQEQSSLAGPAEDERESR